MEFLVEIKEFEILLKKYLEELDIKLNSEQILKFYNYMNLLIEWNKKLNLTAIIDPKDIIIKHFVDSLAISKYIEENAKIIDVGTGAGFPGIPLKIYRNDIEVTLLDSLNKRINFLNYAIESLNLKKIKTIHGRAEDYAREKSYREEFDIATSRAVANMSTLSEYLIPYVKVNGMVIAMKGSDIDEEIKCAGNAIKILGGKITNIDEFELPGTDARRSIVCIKKIKETSSKYPRKAGIPAKEPLY